MRAQVAIELFLTMSIGLLVLFWYSNYLTTFGESTRISGLNLQQQSVVQSLAKSVNEVCLREVNLSIPAPCLKDRENNVLYRVQAVASDPYLLQLDNPVSNYSTRVRVSCSLITAQIPAYLQCAENERLCIYKDATNQVNFREGSC